MRIGIDFGGVIVKPAIGNSLFDSSLGLDMMVPDAFDGIAKLVELAEGNVWIVSKASTATQVATRQWLQRTNFFQFTSFNPGHIYFCAKRYEKAAICSQLQLTHFIDDNKEVLQHLAGNVPHLYLFGCEPTCNWQQILQIIQTSI